MIQILSIILIWNYNDINTIHRIIFILFIIWLNVYPILIIRWVSINNYSVLGIIRLISPIILFEVLIFVMLFMIIIMVIEDFKLINLIFYQINFKSFIFLYLLYFMFIISLVINWFKSSSFWFNWRWIRIDLFHERL